MGRVKYDFEQLEVYQLALKFTEVIFAGTEQIPQYMQYSLGDQLRRTALSVCNNIAEGAHKRGQAKRQFYNHALGSSRECVPMLELAFRRDLIDQTRYAEWDDMNFRIASMLSALVRSVR